MCEIYFYIKFVSIQALIIVSGLIETASFFLILPFINLIADPNIINDGLGLYLLELSGSQDVGRFILFSGIVILFLKLRQRNTSIKKQKASNQQNMLESVSTHHNDRLVNNEIYGNI